MTERKIFKLVRIRNHKNYGYGVPEVGNRGGA